jgi:hypothetical protein
MRNVSPFALREDTIPIPRAIPKGAATEKIKQSATSLILESDVASAIRAPSATPSKN